MRKPKVKNKYNLKFKDISNLQILDETRITKPLFWRNTVINAWCISKEIGSDNDIKFHANNEVWIGIYDKPYYRKRIHCNCSSYGGMCKYEFKEFFKKEEMENIVDLETQEYLLKTINYLIDEKILGLPKISKNKS